MTELLYRDVRNLEQLQAVLRERAEQMNVARQKLDEMTGLPNGYCGKVLAPHPPRNLGRVSMPLLLQALGLKLIAVDDHATLAVMAGRYGDRVESQARLGNAAKSGGVHESRAAKDQRRRALLAKERKKQLARNEKQRIQYAVRKALAAAAARDGYPTSGRAPQRSARGV